MNDINTKVCYKNDNGLIYFPDLTTFLYINTGVINTNDIEIKINDIDFNTVENGYIRINGVDVPVSYNQIYEILNNAR